MRQRAKKTEVPVSLRRRPYSPQQLYAAFHLGTGQRPLVFVEELSGSLKAVLGSCSKFVFGQVNHDRCCSCYRRCHIPVATKSISLTRPVAVRTSAEYSRNSILPCSSRRAA
jgi:hypothetical protein